MVEAGADQVPETTLLEALDLAQQEIAKLCEAQEELRARAGKPKWLDPAVTDELAAKYGDEIQARLQQEGLQDGGAIVEELVEREAGTLTMDSAESDVVRALQARMSLAAILEKKRSAARRGARAGAVRARPARAHRGRAGLEGAEEREVASALRPRSSSRSRCRFPAGPAGGEPASRTA